jgi:hypothetical protein
MDYYNKKISQVNVSVKVYLQGPYTTNAMSASLSGIMPLTQPYNSSPLNYTGSEGVTSIPSGVVDWVMLELRNDLSTIVARRAAFLKNDGSVVDLDGNSPVGFNSVTSGSYYIVLRHRNHLALMSSNPVSLNSSSVQYDFTTSQTKAYGSNPMKDLGSGVFGMYAGDGDGNGYINAVDRNSFWRLQNGTNGYLSADFDLNGSVNAVDRNGFWRVNNGMATQVPIGLMKPVLNYGINNK